MSTIKILHTMTTDEKIDAIAKGYAAKIKAGWVDYEGNPVEFDAAYKGAADELEDALQADLSPFQESKLEYVFRAALAA